MLVWIAETPWGQLPILEYEGATIAQTMTICRFVAKKAGLAGNNALEQAQMDMVADKCDEYTTSKIHDIISRSWEQFTVI